MKRCNRKDKFDDEVTKKYTRLEVALTIYEAIFTFITVLIATFFIFIEDSGSYLLCLGVGEVLIGMNSFILGLIRRERPYRKKALSSVIIGGILIIVSLF